MRDAQPALPPRLLRTEEAARWLGLSGRTLEKHRCTGTGPAYRKIGGRVVYVVDDLQAWIDAGVRRSTSERSGVAPLAMRRPPATERRTFAR